MSNEPGSSPEPIRPLGQNRFSVTHDGQLFEVSAVSIEGRRFLFFGRLLEHGGRPAATSLRGPSSVAAAHSQG